MNGNRLFLDTNIILYLLNGDQTLADLLYNKQLYISIITELELLAYTEITEEEEKTIKDFIKNCTVISINESVKKEAIKIRKKYHTKLPDSIIIATANYLNLPFITSDADFKIVKETFLIYYEN